MKTKTYSPAISGALAWKHVLTGENSRQKLREILRKQLRTASFVLSYLLSGSGAVFVCLGFIGLMGYSFSELGYIKTGTGLQVYLSLTFSMFGLLLAFIGEQVTNALNTRWQQASDTGEE